MDLYLEDFWGDDEGYDDEEPGEGFVYCKNCQRDVEVPDFDWHLELCTDCVDKGMRHLHDS